MGFSSARGWGDAILPVSGSREITVRNVKKKKSTVRAEPEASGLAGSSASSPTWKAQSRLSPVELQEPTNQRPWAFLGCSPLGPHAGYLPDARAQRE